ncbi:MAG: hypothetical protein IJ303_03025 [Clostridia bacterium]|nr:hypothetical protein [Clostridia bacterium]
MSKLYGILSKKGLALILLFSLLLLTACSVNKLPSAEEIVAEMLRSQSSLPIGKLYTKSSSPGAADYLSDSLLSALYGREELPDVFERAESIAIWTASGFDSCEFAVFLCKTKNDAEKIADLCLCRIDIMNHFIRSNTKKLSLDTQIINRIEKAKVDIAGRYVIMVLSDDTDSAIKAAKKIVA